MESSMESTPRLRSLTGMRRPCMMGPMATQRVDCCTALYVLFPGHARAVRWPTRHRALRVEHAARGRWLWHQNTAARRRGGLA
eukprot:1552470-Rhodomonas_salina.2